MSSRLDNVSIVSQGARHQVGIAIALITVIPLLVVAYMWVGPGLYDTNDIWPSVFLVLLLVASIALGYVSLCTYPLNIARLRRYLESIVNGDAPEEVHLLQGMDDIRAIEKSLHLIVEQFNEQLRRLEEEIEHRKLAESLKDDFVSTVSHELRTPLAISKEGISLVLDRIPGELNEKQNKLLETSQRNLDRLARIINDLLDISKIEAGMFEIEKDRHDLRELLAQTVSSLEWLARKKGVSLRLQHSDASIDVYVDRDRMVQVATNLLNNALKFTDEGEIVVSCDVGQDKVFCSVRDTGRGMGPEDAARVFDKFRQFGRTDGAGDRGTGLGLAIVRNIIELHGGSIEVQSRIGKGTTFTFQLPLYTPEKALLETIDQKLHQGVGNDEVLALVLLNLESAEPMDPHDWEQFYRNFYAQFVKLTSVMRDSDVMMSREDHQILFLGQMRPESRAMVAARWRNLVQQSFVEMNPDIGLNIRLAMATYHEEGNSADELLRCAENKIVLLRQKENLQKGAH